MFAWKQGTVLFGDDLDTAAEWIINNLHIAQRPKIFLGGAYSDFNHGCLTFIGREIEKIVGEELRSVVIVAEFGHLRIAKDFGQHPRQPLLVDGLLDIFGHELKPLLFPGRIGSVLTFEAHF